MEAANDTAMLVTETKTLCSSLTCPPSKSEEITKDQEEELLCGNSEDGDEEDALSDDSMRLRLSDDEAELEEPSASEDVINKKTGQEGTNMELGSDVPEVDTSEQKSALRIQKLSNGVCTVESKNMRVNQEDQVSNNAFAEGTVPKPDISNDTSGNTGHCNGDSAQAETKSTKQASIMKDQGNKWKVSGHFGEYSNRANRTSQFRKRYSESNKYASDPFNDKYYNKNSYYGGGKGSGRAHSNSYVRESLSSEKSHVEKYSSRVSSTNTVKVEPESSQYEGASSQPIKSVSPTIQPLDATNLISNDVDSESNDCSKTQESVSNLEEIDGLSRNVNDNAKAAFNILNTLDSEEVSQNDDPSQEEQLENSNVDHDSSNFNVVSEIEKANVSVLPAVTVETDDLSNDVDEKLNKEAEITPEIDSTSASPKNLDNDTKEADQVTEKVDEDASEKIHEPTSELTSGENAEVQNAVKEEVAIEEMDMEDSVSVERNNRSSLERAEVELAAEIQKSDDPTEIDEKKKEEDEAKQSKSPKPESSVEETERSQEDPTAVLAAIENQSKVGESEQALKESLIVATDDSETVETAVASVDKEIPSEPQILDIEAHIADLPDEKETSSEDEGEVNNVRMHTSLKKTSTESLDEMELFKRMRIRRKNNESDEPIVKDIAPEVLSAKEEDVIIKMDNNTSAVVNPVTNSIADCKSVSESEANLISNTVVENLASQLPDKPESINDKENIQKVDDCEVIEVPVKKRQKRSKRSLQTTRETIVSQEDTQEKENVRQKRRTAKNAEEIIRKEFLGNSDSESNDSAGNLVAVNYKTSNTLRAASPPSLKRNYVEEDEKIEPSTIKKMKQDMGSNGDLHKKVEALSVNKMQTLAHVRRFFRRDHNGKLAKLKQEELEELLIQKVVETITMRDEIGKLREQAKISERNQEATRQKCQQLAKQIKDFEMVLNRYQSDRRMNPDKTVVPIKINRSVGLQVNFVTDHGIQNLRQLGQVQKAVTPMVNGTSSPQQQSEQSPGGIQKRGLKVRSPRRPEPPVTVPTNATIQPPVHTQPIVSSITPAALVTAKNITDSRTPVTPTVQQTTVPHLIAPKQTILVNGPIPNQSIRQATAIQVSKANNNDLIDLTQEEDKTKSNVIPQNAILTTAISEPAPSISNVQKIAPRYHTVIQTVPGNVAFTAQQGIRVVQPSSQPTPTALVNNMNAPRLAYVMQSGMGSTRQVVVTSSPAPIRPAPTIRTSYPLTGTITNGTVRVIPMTSTATIQVYKHPAALPEPLNPPSNPTWKLAPPAPSLKISKVANGIVLSWNMALTDKYAEIASYQLYAYQEVSGIAPSSTLWKKVGDVRALPLPMACTLTQFSEGNNYYFAVRAVDKHSRLGLYSQPGNISL